MAKIFDFAKAYPDSQAIAVPDVTWFRKNQRFLLWMANWSQEGQKLLKMEQTDLTRIDEIWPNRVSQYNLDGSITTDFRVGCKWTNLINYQWEWVQEMAKQFQAIEAGRLMTNEWNVPVFGFAPALGATGTYYPEAGGAGTVSCDGDFVWSLAGATNWSSVHDANGSANVSARLGYGASINYYLYQQSGLRVFIRSSIGFDTSSLGSGSLINSSTLTLVSTGKATAGSFTGNIAMNAYAETLANTNNLVASDFLYSNFGTTEFSTSVSYSSWPSSGTGIDFSLNSSGKEHIKKTSTTVFGMRDALYDVANSTPYGNAYESARNMGAYGSSETGNTRDPKLVVDYTPASFIPRTTIIA